MLKPGVYDLSTAMTPYEMMAVMAAKDEEEVDTESEDYVPTKNEANLWDEADDEVKEEGSDSEGGE